MQFWNWIIFSFVEFNIAVKGAPKWLKKQMFVFLNNLICSFEA